jgi:hypothetical protein
MWHRVAAKRRCHPPRGAGSSEREPQDYCTAATRPSPRIRHPHQPSQVAIHGVVGGMGSPLLLLHGNPLTHITGAWSRRDWPRSSPWWQRTCAAMATAASRADCLITATIRSGHTARLYGYEQAWSAYAADLARCLALPCGHYPAEQAPDETYEELRGFFARWRGAAPAPSHRRPGPRPHEGSRSQYLATDRARRPSGDRRSRCRCSE